MLPVENGKDETAKIKEMPTSNSFSDSDRKRERIESYKETRRRELSAKYGSRQDTSPRPLKTSRRKEDLRGGGPEGPVDRSPKNNSPFCENQVPSSDSRRYISRRGKNKTDVTSGGSNDETGNHWTAGSPVTILVRETKASKLRAASRSSASEAGSPSPRLRDTRKTPDKEIAVTNSSSGSSSSNSLTRKDADKSHKRKSHLNRSHTSEGVYEDTYAIGNSPARRRRGNVISETPPLKSDPTKKIQAEASSGSSSSSNAKEVSELCKCPLNTYNKANKANVSLSRSPKPIARSDRRPLHKRQSSGEEKSHSEPTSLPDIKSSPAQRAKPQGGVPFRKSSESGNSFLQKRFSSADNSPVKRLSVKRTNDISKRTEVLTASTMRIVNRLDEMNSKRKKEVAQSPGTQKSYTAPYDTVIDKDKVEISSNVDSTLVQIVPAADVNTAKSQSSLTLRNSRRKSDSSAKIEASRKLISHESPKAQSEVVNKPSILKKKATANVPAVTPVNAENRKPKPVSILKRKSLSQDESSSKTHLFAMPPVTFSPSVLENETRSKRQGILKKRRSLDENEVLRTTRKSASPDSTSPDFKPILKHQRRSSMEELRRRSRSPDSAPQSILKRKSSREEEMEEVSGGEPQGILKRKPSVGCGSGHQHVKISESVILAAAAAVGEIQINETVRPILKKKSSSEEHSTPDLSLSEVPRPILKKKTSLDVDDVEEKPKKPILKSSRKTSLEEPEDGKRSRNPSVSSLELDHVRPILKRDNSRPRSTEEEVVVRCRRERPKSSSDIDEELNSIFNKRRSLELTAVNYDPELRRTKSMSSNDRLKSEPVQRPLSVAERIMNMENFLQVEQLERERRNTPPGSPSSLQSTSPPSKSSPSSESSPTSTTGAVPKFRLGGIVTRQNEGANSRFLPAGHLPYASGSVSPLLSSSTLINSNSDEETGSKGAKYPKSKAGKSSDSDSDDAACNRPPSYRTRAVSPAQSSLRSIRETGEAKNLYCNTSYQSSDSEQSAPSESSIRPFKEYDVKWTTPGDSLGDKFSNLTLDESNMETKELDEEIFLLQRSGSVSAKASLFQEMAKKMEAAADDVKGGNRAVNRRREKLTDAHAQRFRTQPVSSEEVEKAVLNTRRALDGSPEDGENHEDELSSMSLSERVRLFNDRIKNETAAPPPREQAPIRKRSARFRTQPVTTEEVENAQNQRLSPLAASLCKPPDSDLFGLGILSAKALKDKMYDHANLVFRQKSPTQDLDGKSKRKGILKNLSQGDEVKSAPEPKKVSSESDSSDSEIKSILKSELSESFQHLKSVLKTEKESSSGLKGILKQPSFEKKNTSSSEDSSLSEDELLKKKNRTGSAGSNLANILQSVAPKRDVRVSDDESSSSGGVEVRKIIKNEAVAKRRLAGINKLRSNSSLVKSQSHSSVSSVFRSSPKSVDVTKSVVVNGDAERASYRPIREEGDEAPLGGLKRSTTQPLTALERQGDDDMSGASIKERLARLKKSGENDWQKRKSHVTNLEEELSVITTGNYLFNETCVLSSQVGPISPQPVDKKDVNDHRSSRILEDRLVKLETAKEGWRRRVQPSDAVRFSVEGKMLGKTESLSPRGLSLQISPSRTPLAERKKRSPKAVRFRSKKNNPLLSSTPSSPLERLNNPIARSVSAPGSGEDGLFSLAADESNGPVVSVPRADDETFTSFFNGISSERVLRERLEINDEDLDLVTQMKSSQLLVQKRTVKAQRRRATVKNPLKTLAARLDLQEYTEVKTGVAEKELKRLKVEKASRNTTLAIEALAGLASQEDFTAINLKKASDGMNSPMSPYKDLMLLQVKGRRHVQTRLVEPVADSINSGDCFILVTPSKVFHYVGEYANVIEKSRGAEISLHIQQKPDLGCNTGAVITIGGGSRPTSEQVKEFWSLLGADSNHREHKAGHPDEDELFESALIDTNMVFEVVDDELVPYENYWGAIPKIEILNPNKILVFDFGSEFYVWNGKNVKLPDRKIALKLAKELWEEGFDYTDCDICPLSSASYLGSRYNRDKIPDSDKAGPVRPLWALFAKITQNMETVLFREKFLDWPDYSRVIRRNRKDEESEQVDGNGCIDFRPCDAEAMLNNIVSDPDLLLEGSHLGRGISWFDEETRRCSEVTSHDVTVWHISEYDYSELPASSIGQFYMEDSYVVRWHYMITVTGRELSGLPSKHLTTGRDRYAYFCWQGQDSPIHDKGAAACLTVELDKEHGPQVRVVQGFEPPAFLNLFRGAMVVHAGRRESETPPEKWRLFICRGEAEQEGVLFELPCSMRQLRSAASCILVSNEMNLIIVWHGWKSLPHTRKIAQSSANYIQSTRAPEFGFDGGEIKIREEIEGSESRDFIRALGGDNRQLYFSLVESKHIEIKTPRLFHLSSVSGEFLFTEVAPPYLNREVVTPYPFLQSDLYSASQPALFLLDTGSCLWLWQGWMEGETGEGDRGSGPVRFQAERRAAMSTALSYWALKHGNEVKPQAYLVWAGLEPLDFTNLFPIWTDRDDIAEINIRDGRKSGEMLQVQAELASLTQSTFPLAQLQNRPLPDGVNPTTLEDYLEAQCFPDLFGMTKEEFLKMPIWKKKKLKQEVGLF